MESRRDSLFVQKLNAYLVGSVFARSCATKIDVKKRGVPKTTVTLVFAFFSLNLVVGVGGYFLLEFDFSTFYKKKPPNSDHQIQEKKRSCLGVGAQLAAGVKKK